MNAPAEIMRALEAVAPGEGGVAVPDGAPELAMIPLDRLVVNPAYQRELRGRSLTMIRKALANFSWSRFKAINVAAREDGRFEILDGQHSATILLSLGLKAAPCLVTARRSTGAAAEDFVSLNSSRVGITSLHRYRAAVAAGDKAALAVREAAAQAGVTIRRAPPSNGKYRAGETVAVAALAKIAAKRSAGDLARILTACRLMELAPIQTDMIRAAEVLLFEDEYRGELAVEEIAAPVLADREAIEDAADLNRIDSGHPRYRQIAIEIYRRAADG